MSARQWRRTAWMVAASTVATLGTAWAQGPGAGPSCGTQTTTAAPAGDSEEARSQGRRSRPGTGGYVPASGLLPGAVELPTGASSGAPVSTPATPVAGSNPPAPPAPPAVPGLPPAPKATKEKDKDKSKTRGDDRRRVQAVQAQGEVPEERLLDVGIEVFDPGRGAADRERLAEQGLSPELRRAEGRFVSFHLKKTMEATGNWGAVRVLPGPGEGTDVFVSGRIVKSTGKDLDLEVEATDATGRRWLHRRYRGTADLSAYAPERVGKYDPFQDIYNRIANDLLEQRDDLSADQLVTVRRVSAMRFAAQLAPAAFDGYLRADRSGRFELVRMPAEGDPMAHRVSQIHDRDQMLVDTLNDYYLSFYERMGSPYSNWRQYSYQEQAALDKIKRESLIKKILGGGAMLAGVIMSGSDSEAQRLGGDIAMLGGWAAIQAGSRQAADKAIHEAALKELALSVDGEVAPLLVEVEGQQVKLTGSAEKQFAEWRDLLHRVLSVETGVPDPNAPVLVGSRPSSD